MIIATGLIDKSIVMVLADHGHPHGDHGTIMKSAANLYDELLRIPLMIRLPQAEHATERVAPLVQTDDLLPTTLDLLGVKMPNQVNPIDGVSLMPLIARKMDRRPKPMPFEIRRGKAATWAALIDGRYKLHKRKGRAGGKFELYDLVKDAAETTDIAAAQPKVAERMKEHLSKWQASVVRSLAGKDYPRSG